ncbi:MAG: 2-oxoacid:acceptor oxidoreductase family protein [Candidatus Doudnabacteria bacterium]
MNALKIKILIAGEGGQGIQTTGKILGEAAFEQGLKALYVPNFGVEQRGGVSVAFVQIADQELTYPKFDKADLLVLLSERSAKRSETYISPQTKIISNSSLVPKNILPAQNTIIEIDATNIANKEFTPQTLSIIVLGAILPFVPILQKDNVEKAIKKQLGSKFKEKPELEELNYKALERGVDLAK